MNRLSAPVRRATKQVELLVPLVTSPPKSLTADQPSNGLLRNQRMAKQAKREISLLAVIGLPRPSHVMAFHPRLVSCLLRDGTNMYVLTQDGRAVQYVHTQHCTRANAGQHLRRLWQPHTVWNTRCTFSLRSNVCGGACGIAIIGSTLVDEDGRSTGIAVELGV